MLYSLNDDINWSHKCSNFIMNYIYNYDKEFDFRYIFYTFVVRKQFLFCLHDGNQK